MNNKELAEQFILYFRMRERKIVCTAKDENDQLYRLYKMCKEILKKT